LFIFSLQWTFSPARKMFIELGCDLGLGITSWDDYQSGNNYANVMNYHSIFPFAHIGYFTPFRDRGGFFIGAGGGYMMGEYVFDVRTNTGSGWHYDTVHDPISILTLNFITGVNLGNLFNISYTLRANYSLEREVITASNKIAFGFVYRFR